jgi:hypothetical protein
MSVSALTKHYLLVEIINRYKNHLCIYQFGRELTQPFVLNANRDVT